MTQESRDKVKVLLALGWTSPQIADALAISPATLKRHFRADLQERALMRDRVEAERLAALYAQARAGRITAIRELGRVLGTESVPKEPRPERAASLGKKEAAERAALTAGLGTDWGEDLVGPPLHRSTDHDH